jgi:hypothetical protein
MEENKLIAEFMGSKHPTIEDMYRLPHADVYWGELQYDYSWNWLMPVVEKIETISGKLPTHVGNIPNDEDWESNNFLSTNIEETYIAVVRFIKKYNQLKQE